MSSPAASENAPVSRPDNNAGVTDTDEEAAAANDFATAALGGATKTPRGLASAVAGYGLSAGSTVAPATSDEDEAFDGGEAIT